MDVWNFRPQYIMFKIRIFRKRKKKRTSHHVTCYETPDESCVCVRMYRTFFVLSKSKSFTERMGINYLYAYAEKQRTSHHMWNVLFFFFHENRWTDIGFWFFIHFFSLFILFRAVYMYFYYEHFVMLATKSFYKNYTTRLNPSVYTHKKLISPVPRACFRNAVRLVGKTPFWNRRKPRRV